MKITFYTILLVCCSSLVFAQYNTNYKELGDKAYTNKNFYEAAYYYKKSADGLSLTPTGDQIPYQTKLAKKVKVNPGDANYVAFRLAESYRQYENYLLAESWYNKVLASGADTIYPLARFWYATCLRANQHFDGAIAQFTQFKNDYHADSEYPALANKEIANCKFALDQYKFPILMEAAKLKGEWNSDGSNYAMIKRDDNFFFTSSRLVKDDKNRLNRLYTSTGKGTIPQLIDLKSDDNKKNVEYGTPSLTTGGNRMYLTRWYKEGDKYERGIYKTDLTGTTWGVAKALNSNVNLLGFNAQQPFVTSDGKRLYFVSDKPGGQGGQDIWFADLDADGEPINSTNLGPIINTSMDEQAPYYDAPNKRLVYSSKGLTGLGGFDLFESQGDVGYFGKPKNLNYPINSAKDDLYYYPDRQDASKFYISSDRESDCCLDLFQVTDKRYIFSGLVVDCDTKKPLPGVTVSFIDSLSKQVVAEVTTGSDAKYAFKVANNRPYEMRLEKDKYFSKKMSVVRPAGKMMKDSLFSPEICLQSFEINKPIVINNILYDFNKADLRDESKTILNGLVTILKDNPKMKIELSAHTDSIGSDAYNTNLSQMRAQACVDYIVASGIETERLFAKGYGKTKPIAPNSLPNGQDNPEGRQLNRRTEFTVLKLDNTVTKLVEQ